MLYRTLSGLKKASRADLRLESPAGTPGRGAVSKVLFECGLDQFTGTVDSQDFNWVRVEDWIDAGPITR